MCEIGAFEAAAGSSEGHGFSPVGRRNSITLSCGLLIDVMEASSRGHRRRRQCSSGTRTHPRWRIHGTIFLINSLIIGLTVDIE